MPLIRGFKTMMNKVLHADDTPHRIAWGFALGIWLAWTPTVGIQMIIGAIMAKLFRGNVAAAVAAVWISNPWTIVFMYWLDYEVGYLFVGGPMTGFNESWDYFMNLVNKSSEMGKWEYMKFAWSEMMRIYLPMFLGGLILGFITAPISYYMCKKSVIKYREKKDRIKEILHIGSKKKDEGSDSNSSEESAPENAENTSDD